LDPDSRPSEILMGIVRRRFPELGDLTAIALEEIHRQRFLTKKRAAVTRTDHRFFLALLLNLSSRAEILARLADAHPRKDPRHVATGIVKELTRDTSLLGFELTDDMVDMFRAMLDGCTGPALVHRCRERFALSRDDAREIREFDATIRGSRMFR